MISRDEGRSWDQECKVILSAESVYQFCGGGSSVQLADGKIVTAYFQHQGTGPVPAPAHLLGQRRVLQWTLCRGGQI